MRCTLPWARQAGKRLDIEGMDAAGVMSAVEMLGRIGDGDYPDFAGKKVVVVGGGNVAMDCARTSVRAGRRRSVGGCTGAAKRT